MTRSHLRVRRSPEEWREILDELGASGLSRNAFCRKKGLVPETLRQAEQRLERQESTRSFVELAPPVLEAMPVSRWDIELDLGDGVVLRLARR